MISFNKNLLKKIDKTAREEDSDDNIIIACAVEAEADYIITGDNDLLSLKKYKSIKIINAARFLDPITG